MAKRRMISPETWEDEHFGSLSDKAKILFIACISNADDDGRLSGNPANLRAIAFRFEDISINKIEELAKEISDKMDNFKHYVANGCKYIQLLKWKDHQAIREDRYKPSKFPVWQPKDNQKTAKGQPTDRLDKVSIDKVSIDKSKDSASQASPALSEQTKKTLDTVYKKGFNIYTLLGKFKKERGYDLPEPVMIKVGNCYINHKGTIKNPWAWFLVSAKEASKEYFAEQSKKEGAEWKKSKSAQAIKDIMVGIGSG